MKACYLTATLVILVTAAIKVYAEPLQAVINRALHSNPEVQASVNNVMASRQQLEQAKAAYYPDINLSAAVGRESTESPATGFIEENLTRQELRLELRQNLFEGFATESEVARQRALLRSAGFTLEQDRDVVALRIAEAYIDVLRHREIVTLADGFVKDLATIYRKIEKRSASGVGRTAEKVHASGRLALARSTRITAAANLDNSMIDYLAVVGELPADDLVLPETTTVVTQLEAALRTARDKNPAIAAADADVEAAMQNRSASNSGFYPSVDVLVSGSRNQDVDGIPGDDDDQSIMLQLRYNLFRGGSDSARKQQASYEMARAKYVRDNAYRVVDQRIRSAWNELQSREQQLVDLRQHLEASIKTRNVYEDQYRIGKRTLLDLLNTENELFNARVAHTNALHDRVRAQHRLLAYMGELAGEADK